MVLAALRAQHITENVRENSSLLGFDVIRRVLI